MVSSAPISPTNLLIVGGAGFIGAHLVKRCIAAGHAVHVIARPTSDTSRLAALGAGITRHRLFLSDQAAVRRCLVEARPSHIFHMVGDTGTRHNSSRSQALGSAVAVSELLALIDAAARADQPPRFFLRTGSIAEYGAGPIPFCETQQERPRTGYAAGLVAGTRYAEMLAPDLPFALVTARPSLVYGPGQASDFLVPFLISALSEGRPAVLERPLDRRDILHVDDVVDALLALAAAPAVPATVNIGSGQLIAVEALAEMIAAIVGANPSLIGRRPQGEATTLLLDGRRLFDTTGWRPRIGLVRGLQTLAASYLPQARLPRTVEVS